MVNLLIIKYEEDIHCAVAWIFIQVVSIKENELSNYHNL